MTQAEMDRKFLRLMRLNRNLINNYTKHGIFASDAHHSRVLTNYIYHVSAVFPGGRKQFDELISELEAPNVEKPAV